MRPGAAPMPGVPPSGPGGIPGQVRPPVNVGPVAGRGRGDWRPPGMKGGYGMSGWGGGVSGRGFGIGLEFTLPSHKYVSLIYDILEFAVLSVWRDLAFAVMKESSVPAVF